MTLSCFDLPHLHHLERSHGLFYLEHNYCAFLFTYINALSLLPYNRPHFLHSFQHHQASSSVQRFQRFTAHLQQGPSRLQPFYELSVLLLQLLRT